MHVYIILASNSQRARIMEGAGEGKGGCRDRPRRGHATPFFHSLMRSRVSDRLFSISPEYFGARLIVSRDCCVLEPRVLAVPGDDGVYIGIVEVLFEMIFEFEKDKSWIPRACDSRIGIIRLFSFASPLVFFYFSLIIL